MDDKKDLIEKFPDEARARKGNGEDEEIHIEIIDPDAPEEPEEPDPPAEVAPAVDSQLEALRKEKDHLVDRLLRKQADFENYRKRAEKEKREFQQYALADLMLELVPILDNFDRAMSHADDQSGPEYRKGVELIYRQLRDLLEKRGLRQVSVLGQPFDPNFHEAISREENNKLPENTILQELQKGYYFRDKLLRPAMVKVSFRADPEEAKRKEDDDETDES